MNEEQGDTVASVGVIQLILDMLKQSCFNPGTNDFEISGGSMLTRVEIESYMSRQTSNKVGSNSGITHDLHHLI